MRDKINNLKQKIFKEKIIITDLIIHDTLENFYYNDLIDKEYYIKNYNIIHQSLKDLYFKDSGFIPMEVLAKEVIDNLYNNKQLSRIEILNRLY